MDKIQDGKFGRNSWEEKDFGEILEEVFEENGKGGGSRMQGKIGWEMAQNKRKV